MRIKVTTWLESVESVGSFLPTPQWFVAASSWRSAADLTATGALKGARRRE